MPGDTSAGGVDRQCPDCGREAVAVCDVQVLGQGEADVHHGTVHYARDGASGGTGSGWRLYIHEGGDAA